MKKLFGWLAITALSAGMLVGCGNEKQLDVKNVLPNPMEEVSEKSKQEVAKDMTEVIPPIDLPDSKSGDRTMNKNPEKYFKDGEIGAILIAKEWMPVGATLLNNEEVSLQEVYGSGIQEGGKLTFTREGRFAKYIGIYGDEKENHEGEFEIEDSKSLSLVFDNGNFSTVRVAEKEGKTVLLVQEGEFLVFFQQ